VILQKMSLKKTKLVHCISSLQRGGAEEVVCSLIEALIPEYTQTVVYFYDGPHRISLEAQGIRCIQIQGLIAPYDLLAFIRFFKIIRALKPDVMHSALWLANLFARITGKLLRIKTVNSLHNTITRDHDGYMRILIDKISLTLADHIIAVTPLVALSAPRAIQHKIRVIPNGINHQKLLSHPRISREQLQLDQEHFVIGAVGRFVPVKNHTLLITCFSQIYRKHPHTRLVLLGAGPLEQDIRTHIKNLRLEHSIRLVIAQPAQHYYALFDCFAQPSKNEGLSIALLEALSFALPAIVTGQHQSHPVITDAIDGIVIHPDSVTQLVNALETLILNKQLCDQLGKQGSALVQKHYSLTAMAQTYSSLLGK